MELHGQNLIAGAASAVGGRTFRAVDPSTSEVLPTTFHEATAEEVDRALLAAATAFAIYRRTSGSQIAAFLRLIATEVEGVGDALLARTHAETGLPLARLTGERARMLAQIRLFADLAAEGSWCGARIDHADPDRRPAPKPDVRTLNVPVGPVVVFGASNFPLAISVAGTDTISALAVGCPVVVKAHPAHPGTGELVGRAITRAAQACALPAGVFSMVHGAGADVGLALVRHPAARAVAFTGSLRGGRALFDAAAARRDPIPVHAEMGSINPVLVLPGALRARGPQIATAYLQSVTLGVGQFCTNPGLLLGLAGPDLDDFCAAAAAQAEAVAPATMLHAGIREAFVANTERLAGTIGVSVLGRSAVAPDPQRTQAPCVLFVTGDDALEAHPHLTEEIFGPTSTIVACRDEAELCRAVERLEGHLVASLFATTEDLAAFADVIALLETKVGRIVLDGFGTGIEVCAAMNHGGPYPATTDARFTSIGHAAYLRFVRPICYQGFPDAALPAALREENVLGIWRVVDGRLTAQSGSR